MLGLLDVADVLGLPMKQASRSSIGLISRIDDGLPTEAVERIAKLLAPADAAFKYRLIPRATYERRKATRILSAEEGTLLARLARIWGLAVEVWQDEEEARAFLFRPHPMVEDRRPIDLVIQSEFGAEAVLDVLNGLKYGTAA